MLNRNALLAGRKVRSRYDISEMTLSRWMRDADLKFPPPIKINRRNYWRVADLEKWERGRARASRQVA